MSKPARFLDAEGTGIKTRYDDFVAIHMNQTLTVHGTANFLSWHRYLVWTYENALRDECGYPGYQPYWNWAKYALDPINSPLFDGSSTSMSGNGAYEAHNCTDALGTGVNCIPPGIGGGCVESGPFAGITINLGPVAPTLAEPEEIAVTNMFDWNPRCLKRDISPWVSSQWTTDQNITDVINQNLNIVDFQYNLQGGDFSTGDYGVHAGGHYTLGGADPGGDIFVSPGDPVFWLHHAAIDRTWWIWQNQDPVTRTSALGGTITMYNSPASRNGTLEDILDMGVNGPSSAIGPVMSTIGLTGGPLCYIYV
ncbi:putative tyrosinase [Thozetella sp. PMI_491]|nr:putative tyrosinase [Thozetella sp. PMI_491]